MELAGDDLLLTLYSGSMQEVPKNDAAQLQRLFYDIDRIRVQAVVNALTSHGQHEHVQGRSRDVRVRDAERVRDARAGLCRRSLHARACAGVGDS